MNARIRTAVPDEHGPADKLLSAGRLPTFVGVGAAKSGTTSFHAYLRQHPDVFMSPIKETNFFSTDIDPRDFSPLFERVVRQRRLNLEEYVNGDQRTEHRSAYVRELDHYKKLFRFAATASAVGEISNSYLYSATAARQIRSLAPDARIVMVLRNPVDRAYSHYLANVRDGLTIQRFRDEIDHDQQSRKKGWGISHLYVDLGLYHEQVLRYMEVFDRKQLKIVTYDEFVRDPSALMSDIFSFIGVDAEFSVDMTTHHNAARVPRYPRLMHRLTHAGVKRPLFYVLPRSLRPTIKELFFRRGRAPQLPPSDRDAVLLHFRHDIERLSDLLGRDLSHWMA